MIILFDHQTFSLQNYGGISRYFSELINGVQRAPGIDVKLPPFYSTNAYLPPDRIRPLLPGLEFPKKIKLVYAINKQLSLAYLRKNTFSVIHPTYYDPYFLPYVKGRPVVVTFLDMIHEKFSAQYRELAHDKAMTNRKRTMAENATVIIAISENTKKDIVELYGVDPARIRVIYLGNSMALPSSNGQTPVPDRPYLLFVGNRGFYKNFDRTLEAVAPLLIQYGVDLLCVGGGSFTAAERKAIGSLRVEAHVSQRNVTDQDLAQLYRQATAFLFPSIYEGFGIPVLEAFACQCPCVLSNSSSLPEVGGAAALYVDPTDTDSIRSSVRTILDDSTLRTTLVQRGTKQLQQFSWQKTVDETLDLYRSL